MASMKQEHIKASTFNICFPADACPRYSFQWQESHFVTVALAPCMRKALSGFAMSVLISFRDDYHNAVGLGIRCICRWKTKKGTFDQIERVYKCWAPRQAPGVQKDHIFVLYDAKMHVGSGEGMDQITLADVLRFEFHTVSGENKHLGANCAVAECDVKVIMDSKDDTILTAVSRASEEISNIEELPLPLPKKPEATICSPPFSNPHKLFNVASKVKSEGSVLSRWVGWFGGEETKKS